jgi:hypothetical protein
LASLLILPGLELRGPGRAVATAKIKRRLTEAGDRELADDDGPIFSTVAKLDRRPTARHPSIAQSLLSIFIAY